MSDQWDIESGRPGPLSRLLVPQSGVRPATTAFVLGILAALAFVASLLFEWQKVTQTVPGDDTFNIRTGTEYTVFATLGTVDILGEVYLLGMVALLGLVGSVLMRPDLALRLRMGVSGVAVGLIGIVMAVVLRFPKATASALGGFFGGPAATNSVLAEQKVSYQTGFAAALAAILLATAAVWLAARPAVRALTSPQAMYASPPPTPPTGDSPPPVSTPGTQRIGHVDELSVSPSEPVDLSTTPNPWAQ